MKIVLPNKKKIVRVLILFIFVMGLNLSIEGHFFPNNILPYVFLVMGYGIVHSIDGHILLADIRKHSLSYLVLFAIVTALYCFLLGALNCASLFQFMKIVLKAAWVGISFSILIWRILKKETNSNQICMKNILFSIMLFAYFYQYQCEIAFSAFPIMLLLLYLGNVRENEQEFEKKQKCIVWTMAIIISMCETIGNGTMIYDGYASKLLWFGYILLGICVWVPVSYQVACIVFGKLEQLNYGKEETQVKQINWWVISVLMLLFRLPYLLNWYPGLLSKDTVNQIEQAIGKIEYSNHQPWLHTMIIKFFLKLGECLNGGNQLGVASMTVFTMVVTSLLLAILIKYFDLKKVNRKVLFLFAATYVIGPIHCIYSVHIWKDTLFAYSLLCFVFILIMLDDEWKERNNLRALPLFLFVVCSFFFCFLRTNGLYAWFISIPFIFYHFRKAWKRMLVTILLCLGIIGTYKQIVLPMNHVPEADIVESLSVPLQQIAFTISDKGKMSDEETMILANIANLQELGNVYDSHISDPVKNYIRSEGNEQWLLEHKVDFIRCYLSIGLKNPISYLVAFANQSKGYWYQKLSNYMYFFEGVHQFANESDIYGAPVFPNRINAMVTKLMDLYCRVWHMLWSLALNSYVVVICLFYACFKRKPCYFMIPVIGVLLTLIIATPVNDEFRYAYGIYLCLPLVVLKTVAGNVSDGELQSGVTAN